ncbi:MAG TPA: phosphatidate cytidylyltransferase [candidate division Zixibacteria bacterium]|nr:phosphatidate cytidylyltransferase [candidate division Zixibacteria bacterium]
MLRTRLISAAVLAPLVLAIVFLGEPWLSALVGLIAFLALVETVSLLDAAGFEPPQVLTLGLGVVVAASVLVAANQALVGGLLAEVLRATTVPGLPVVTYAGSVLLLAVASFIRAEPRAGFLTWATSSFGVAYAAMLVPFIVLVAHLHPAGGTPDTEVGGLGLQAGSAWALLLIVTVWGYDTGAYLVGRAIGRHRLIDHISPGKTIEGLAGGLVVATLGAGLGVWLVGLPAWQALVLGPLLGLAAQSGDLAESLLKRAAGRKESGFLIPGHGGMLDRIDSFLFAAPTLAGFALLVGGASL